MRVPLGYVSRKHAKIPQREIFAHPPSALVQHIKHYVLDTLPALTPEGFLKT